MMTSLFTALATFFLSHKADIAAKIAASAGYDLLKKSLNFKPLIQKLKGFFKKETESEDFVQSICDSPLPENGNAVEAVELKYEQLTGSAMPQDLLAVLREWFEENQEAIAQINSVHIEQSSGFAVGVQNAQGNIINVTGDYNVHDSKK